MKKGISIVSLVIIIVIMIILAGVVIISGTNSVKNVTINSFGTEILNIQTAVDEYYYRHGKYPTGNNITLNVSNIVSSSLYQFNEESIVNNTISLKEVDLSAIGINDIEFGNKTSSQDVYVLSELSSTVYYLSGIEYQGKTYYTLTDELYQILGLTNIASNNMLPLNEIKRYDVVFKPTTMEYTNEPIVIEVKLPTTAVINEITVTDGKSISGITTSRSI